MTLTPAVLLIVALFWTLPASAAVVVSRNDDSIEKMKGSAARLFNQPQLDA